MQPRFEPMGVGAILDRTFRLYARNFVPFIAIVAVVQVPLSLLEFGLVQGIADGMPRATAGPLLLVLLEFVLGLVGMALAGGALARAVSEVYLGRDVSVGGAYRAVVHKLLSLVGASILVSMVMTLGLAMCIVPGIIFAVWLALTTQVIVLEDRRAIAGMERSRALASGNLIRVFVLIVVTFAISYILGALFGLPARAIARRSIAGGPEPSTSVALAAHLLEMAGAVLIAPIAATARILLYYDLRIRKEAFDLEMLAQSLQAGSD